eukprot:CAMPEP_0198200748 /NCGR_PEP_ID=MMETSP1445-20131203/3706_1 /TAXON_ID=36898 /ORGANISM="Pyramimonas sp., Strain CCMP2087" /LENGTH=614 /DNA_ID=CAMNT_0043870893 /DNA_START=303 /DNA_END=2144 /DNA_ORIENTATION=+
MFTSLEKELICPLCHNLYEEPQSLPCSHIFCRECIIGKLQGKGVYKNECPLAECKKPVWRCDLKLNTTIANVVSQYRTLQRLLPQQNPEEPPGASNVVTETNEEHPSLSRECTPQKRGNLSADDNPSPARKSRVSRHTPTAEVAKSPSPTTHREDIALVEATPVGEVDANFGEEFEEQAPTSVNVSENELGPTTPVSQECRLLAAEIAEMESVIQDISSLLTQCDFDSATIAETQSDPKQSRSTLEDVLTLLKEGRDVQKFSSAHLRLIYKCIYEHLPRTTGVVSLRRKLSKLNRETVLETVAAMVDAQLTASQQAGSNRRGDPSCPTSAPGEASTHEAGGQDRDTSDKPLECNGKVESGVAQRGMPKRVLRERHPNILMSEATSAPRSILCTGLDGSELLPLLQQLCKKHNTAYVTEFREDVTHVVADTITEDPGLAKAISAKYLYGIAAGCWVVSHHWVSACAQAGCWVDEAPFELRGAATKTNQVIDGPARGRLRVSEKLPRLFLGHRFHFVGEWRSGRVTKDIPQLQLMVRLAGGRLLLESPPPLEEHAIADSNVDTEDAEPPLLDIHRNTWFICSKDIRSEDIGKIQEDYGQEPILGHWIMDSIACYEW